MEIRTSPHRPATTPWGRLVLLALILAPVSALVLLPVGLGLERYVMSGSSMDGDRSDSIPRGAVAFERLVPVNDLRPGDVITFPVPAGAGHVDDADGRERVTHRIVSIGTDGIVTQGDANPEPDPWRLRPDGTVVPRVVLVVPWIGYAHLLVTGPLLLLLAGASAAVLLLLVLGTGRRRRTTSAVPAVAHAGGQP